MAYKALKSQFLRLRLIFFGFVVLISAIFVVVLRNQTTHLGYELVQLKLKEKELSEKKLLLYSRFAKLERATYQKYVISSNILQFPSPTAVFQLPPIQKVK
jgi:hypothetical protein